MERESLQSSRRIEWAVWSAIGLTVLVIVLAFVRSQIAAREPSGLFADSQAIDLTPIAQVPDFTLTNQDGRAVSLADLRGNVWVADVIFTQCAGPCPTMTQHMSDLQAVLPAQAPVKFVTLSTDPEFDHPQVLKRYGERFKADFDRWTFLTGTKKSVAHLAVDGMKLVAMEKRPEERETDRDLFVHSRLFVLVDKQGRLRGSVESYDPQMKQKVVAAVKQLLREK